MSSEWSEREREAFLQLLSDQMDRCGDQINNLLVAIDENIGEHAAEHDCNSRQVAFVQHCYRHAVNASLEKSVIEKMENEATRLSTLVEQLNAMVEKELTDVKES